jgi:CRISPR/Cas system-associated exonuclease Cas4 (RecB family)
MGRSMEARQTPHYSISQLRCFAGCPRLYKFRYIEKAVAYPLYALVSGKSMHAGLEENNLELKAGRNALTKGQIVDRAVAEFETTEGIDELDIEPSAGVDKMVKEISKPVETYIKDVQPQLIDMKIEEAEQEIIEQVAGHNFLAYVDLTTSDMLFDYKLAGRRKSQAEVNLDPQLVMYEKFLSRKGAFIVMLRGKNCVELCLPERSQRTTKAIVGWCGDTIKQIEKAKKADVFPRICPTEWRCGNCQFRFKCFKRK